MVDKHKFIPVAEPALVGNEKKYVLDCIDSNWISSVGQYVERFESEFAIFTGTRHAMACSNGTAALHLALRVLDVEPGDEVIVPAMTFVATANAVAYCGAKPVFADCDPNSWNMDPTHVESLLSPRTKAIIAVHLFGLPANMRTLQKIADQHGISIVEDAAEAHGARYQGRSAGSLGRLATFSFYGNKILTTGEGGMITTDDDELAARVRFLKGQALDAKRRYWHTEVGYNYRLTNLAAAIGLGQLEQAEWHIGKRREIAKYYRKLLAAHPRIQFQELTDDVEHAYWMTAVVLRNVSVHEREMVMCYLLEKGIETRPFFVPMHQLPMYSSPDQNPLPIAEYLGEAGINLPSGATLTNTDQDRVAEGLFEALDLLN